MIDWFQWFRKLFGVPFMSPEVEQFLSRNPEARILLGISEDDGPTMEARAFLDNMDRFIIKQYGPRCEIAKPGCQTCQLWRLRDLLQLMLVN